MSAALTESTGAGTHPSNLLKLAVDAARARATTGEISAALEGVWGRHVASTQVVQGAYKVRVRVRLELGFGFGFGFGLGLGLGLGVGLASGLD